MPCPTTQTNAANTRQVAVGQNRVRVKGYYYPLAATTPTLRSFGMVVDPNFRELLPKIDVASRFLNPNNAPIYSTVVAVDHRRFLIVGYFDILVPQNLNVKEVFPHLPWHGELAVFSLGKRVHLLSRPAGGRYVIGKAIALYIRAVMEMRVAGYEAPFQVTCSSGFNI